MNPLHPSRLANRHEPARDAAHLIVDANAPCMRDFVLRHVLKGTIRVIPAGRGKLTIIPTATWFPDMLLPSPLTAGGDDGNLRRMGRPGEVGNLN